MTADQYVEAVIAKYAVPRGPTSPAEMLGAGIAPAIRNWAGAHLSGLTYSGSYAKGTGVHGVADVDLFISLKSTTPGTLKVLFESLYSLAEQQGWSPRRQNVSVGIEKGGTKADLVPGRVQEGYANYHSLYRRKGDTWTQTNVALHVSEVVNSGRTKEIRALKVWRAQQSIEIPSLLLELFVIEALKGRPRDVLAQNVIFALRSIASQFESARIVDPANSNNVLSDLLDASERRAAALKAASSASKQSWAEIIS